MMEIPHKNYDSDLLLMTSKYKHSFFITIIRIETCEVERGYLLTSSTHLLLLSIADYEDTIIKI